MFYYYSYFKSCDFFFLQMGEVTFVHSGLRKTWLHQIADKEDLWEEGKKNIHYKCRMPWKNMA